MKKLIFIFCAILLPLVINAQNFNRPGTGYSGILYSESAGTYHSLYAEVTPQSVDSLVIKKNAIFYQEIGRASCRERVCLYV